MKFVSEYRDAKAAERLAAAIRQKVTRPWTIMEICGGQTHTIVKSGLEDLLPMLLWRRQRPIRADVGILWERDGVVGEIRQRLHVGKLLRVLDDALELVQLVLEADA